MESLSRGWEEARPLYDWSGLNATWVTKSKSPNQLHPTSSSGAQKSYNYRQKGLKTSFDRGSDLSVFQTALLKKLQDTGLDTITYMPHPKDPPLIVLSPMTLIGTKLNLHLLYPIQLSMGSSVDVFLLTNASGRFITSMHSTRSRVLITTNFTTPWSNLREPQIASLTSSPTMLIVHDMFATMRQWRPLLSS
jgi:hypothetical protein